MKIGQDLPFTKMMMRGMNALGKYKKPEDSFRDHSDFLKIRQRYAFLFQLDPCDYKDWSYGLKKAGYATNPSYAQELPDKIY